MGLYYFSDLMCWVTIPLRKGEGSNNQNGLDFLELFHEENLPLAHQLRPLSSASLVLLITFFGTYIANNIVLDQ